MNETDKNKETLAEQMNRWAQCTHGAADQGSASTGTFLTFGRQVPEVLEAEQGGREKVPAPP